MQRSQIGRSEALVRGSSQIRQGAGKRIEARASSVCLIIKGGNRPKRRRGRSYRRLARACNPINTYVGLRQPNEGDTLRLRALVRGWLRSLDEFAIAGCRHRRPSNLRARGRYLQNSLFLLFLASNAVARPGHRFETLLLQFLMARGALAELFVLDALECIFHQ